MFYDSENISNSPIDILDIESVYSYIEKLYPNKVTSKLIIDISEFLTSNKDKIYEIYYGSASLKGFTGIANFKNHLGLQFQSASLIISKSCVVALVDTKDEYSIYYAITKKRKEFEIIVENNI